MEYQAMAEAVATRRASATVFSDNQSLVDNLTKRLLDWGRSGFVNVDGDIVASVRRIHRAIDERRLTVRFQWIRAHNGNPGNERADALSARGAREAKRIE
jgi:ribonuclease HI